MWLSRLAVETACAGCESPSATTMTFQTGDTLADYKIIGALGRGGMGHVFKVEHVITKRFEAMKVLLHGQANQAELVQRFLREVQVQASLDHPNIASVHNA